MPERPEAGDDDGRVHRLAQDGRLPLPEVDHAQPVLQDQLDLAAGAQAAGQVETGLAVEGGAEAAEGLLPPGVAEVVEPGRGDGGGPQVLGLERDHRAPVVAEAAPERDHLVGPRAARRGGPGHGASPYPQRVEQHRDWGDGRRRPDVERRDREDGRGRRDGETGRGRMIGERAAPDLSVDEIVAVLAAGADRPLDHGSRSPSSTTRCRRRRSWRTVGPATTNWRRRAWCTTSAICCPAAATRPTPTTAARRRPRARGGAGGGIVALHVEAKRYLVATEGGYGGVLADDSVVSLVGQGGAMPTTRRRPSRPCRGRPTPWRCAGPTTARRSRAWRCADLARWAPLLRELSEQAGAGRG